MNNYLLIYSNDCDVCFRVNRCVTNLKMFYVICLTLYMSPHHREAIAWC